MKAFARATPQWIERSSEDAAATVRSSSGKMSAARCDNAPMKLELKRQEIRGHLTRIGDHAAGRIQVGLGRDSGQWPPTPALILDVFQQSP